MSRAMVLSEVTFRELFETSVVLEVAAADAAALKATTEQIELLERNQEEAEAAAGDPQRLAEVDRQFHALIATLAGNRVLELAREPAALLFFPTTAMICASVPEAAPRLLEAHRHIIAAIRARNVEEARLWMSRHVVDWKRGFTRAGHDVNKAVETMVASQNGAAEPAKRSGTTSLGGKV
jgi:GntR family transcriptional regulator, transcriptional repressor for pyruvate dehydrogenase complex